MPENYYDEVSQQWVTSESRYAAIASRPQYERLNHLIYSEPETAWPLLLQLVAEAPDDLLGFAGAGPVETFIWQNGAAFIGRIEAEAKTNPRFRSAAFEINLARGELPADVESRIVAAIGGGFELLPSESSPHRER